MFEYREIIDILPKGARKGIGGRQLAAMMNGPDFIPSRQNEVDLLDIAGEDRLTRTL